MAAASLVFEDEDGSTLTFELVDENQVCGNEDTLVRIIDSSSTEVIEMSFCDVRLLSSFLRSIVKDIEER